MLVYYKCPAISGRINKKLETVVASRKGNWVLGRLIVLPFFPFLTNIDFITFLKNTL